MFRDAPASAAEPPRPANSRSAAGLRNSDPRGLNMEDVHEMQ